MPGWVFDANINMRLCREEAGEPKAPPTESAVDENNPVARKA